MSLKPRTSIRDLKIQDTGNMYSRRDVIKTAVAMPALLGAQSPNDIIRVAVIGVGNRGSYLLRTLLKIPGIRVIAIGEHGLCNQYFGLGNLPNQIDVKSFPACESGSTAVSSEGNVGVNTQ